MTTLTLKTLAKRAFTPKYLFWTNTSLGIAYLTTADVIQQVIIDPYFKSDGSKHHSKKSQIDTNRIQAMCVGGTVLGSLGHVWYTFLDKRFPGTSRSIITKKLIAEAAAGIPFGLTVFTTVGTLEGKSVNDCVTGFSNNIVMFCLADWGFYVPLQFLNFYFVPPHFRFLFVSGISLVYDIFLSFILHREHE